MLYYVCKFRPQRGVGGLSHILKHHFHLKTVFVQNSNNHSETLFGTNSSKKCLQLKHHELFKNQPTGLHEMEMDFVIGKRRD